ncbi:MAG TPA: nucleoside-diphosphate-sugar pyrophosphorylase, partial [Porphyromonadaceae bacterium]|nr:nucleoside-diphosphate-sugar pyrophosphorylase [Porphyromonadaceae bacterium]
RQLVKSGLRLKAWPFSKIVDVDHPEDIRKAEKFLESAR